jgi:hypothetical protein
MKNSRAIISVYLYLIIKRQNFRFFFCLSFPNLIGSVSVSLPTEIRSREENRKKYGVTDVKIY